MKITRSPKFYYELNESPNWLDTSVKELRNRHPGWEFKVGPTWYRFINPERTVVKYYRFNGSIMVLPMSILYEPN